MSEEEQRQAKRIKLDTEEPSSVAIPPTVAETSTVTSQSGQDKSSSRTTEDARDDPRRSGIAPVKAEYLLPKPAPAEYNDDEAESGAPAEPADGRDQRNGNSKSTKNKNKQKRGKGGQNVDRTFGSHNDSIRLCTSLIHSPEFSPRVCRSGEKCRMCHDLRKYLKDGRREDLKGVLDGKCHVFETYGCCASGWKCLFVGSHMKEVEHPEGEGEHAGRKELVLVQDVEKMARFGLKPGDGETRYGIYNVVSASDKIDMERKRVAMDDVDTYIAWLEKDSQRVTARNNRTKAEIESEKNQQEGETGADMKTEDKEDSRAGFVEPPLKPSEKRRLYFGRETPVLAPLTTQGNLPFRRLCVELGCEFTYSEMALSRPLVQGLTTDWTLMRAHESEIRAPNVRSDVGDVVKLYDNSRDLRFGAQIESNQPKIAIKATNLLTRFCENLRLVDLNCGCPVDKIFKAGSGSALLESPGKIERIVRGMNTVSGEVPVTVKLRMGVRSNTPIVTQLLGRLAFGGRDNRALLGAPGCAAITLHGRSREQRYTKRADWSYIAQCATMVNSYNQQRALLIDTVREPDASTLANTKDGRMYFLGNGDCMSHVEYFDHIDNGGVDSVMIGRGALVKPWLFEEIKAGQYLDKSATERLAYIEKFARYGLEAWGSDDKGIGFTRRFLLEWLSFTHRYIPIGLLEHLPPSLNDRPPAFKGRNELETLMASPDYRDWIKITEMFLGPAHPDFNFTPKHKSNSYEAEG